MNGIESVSYGDTGSELLILQAQNLSVGYDGRTLIKDVDIELRHGELLVVSGANGAGKSTLIRSLFDLQKPLGGVITWFDETPGQWSTSRLISAGVRFLGQGDRMFPGMRVLEQYRAIGASLASGRRFEQSLNSSSVTSTWAGRSVGSLSVGQRKRVALEALDQAGASVFLLDEPLAGLDECACQGVIEWLKFKQGEGSTFLIIEHRLTYMEQLEGTMIMLERGQASKAMKLSS